MTRVVLVGWVDELVRRECGTTLLTLVTVSVEVMTARTLAHYVAVGEELARHLVTILLLCYLLQFALVIKGTEEVGGKLMVNL